MISIYVLENFKVPEIYSAIGLIGVGIGLAGALVVGVFALNALLRARGDGGDGDDPVKKIVEVVDVPGTKETLSNALDQKSLLQEFINKIGACSMYIISGSIGALVSYIKHMVNSDYFMIIYNKVIDGSLAGITDVQREAVLFFNVVREMPAGQVEPFLRANIDMVKVHLLNLTRVAHILMASIQVTIDTCEAALQQAAIQTISSFIEDAPLPKPTTPNYSVYGLIAIGLGVVGYVAYKYLF